MHTMILSKEQKEKWEKWFDEKAWLVEGNHKMLTLEKFLEAVELAYNEGCSMTEYRLLDVSKERCKTRRNNLRDDIFSY